MNCFASCQRSLKQEMMHKEIPNYYVSLVPDIKNPEFKHEKAYSQMRYPGTGYRLLSAFAWKNTILNWPLIANQFKILYQDRVKINELYLIERC